MVQSIKYCIKQPLYWVYTAIAILALSKQLYQESILIDSIEYLKKSHFLFVNWFEVNVPQERILEPLRRTIGYPFVLFCLKYNHLGMYFLQLLLTLMIPILMHQLTLRLNYFKQIWNISMLILITFPLQFYYSAFLMPEIWVQFFLLLWVLSIFEGHKILGPICLTVLILFKPVFIILLPIPILLALNKSRKISFFDGFPILVISCFLLLNKYQYGVYAYSSVGYTNAYDYNRKKYLLVKTNDVNKVDKLYEKESQEINQYKRTDFEGIIEYLNAKTTPILLDPVYWLVHIKGTLATYFDPGRYDAMVFFNWDKTSGFMGVNNGHSQKHLPLYQWVYIGFFAILSLLKMGLSLFALFQWRGYGEIRLMVVIILFLTFMAGPVGSARYLMPLYPILAYLGALGYFSMRKQLSK